MLQILQTSPRYNASGAPDKKICTKSAKPRNTLHKFTIWWKVFRATTEKCTIADDDGEWEFSIWFVFCFVLRTRKQKKRNKTFAQETSFDGGSGTFPSFQFLNWGHFTPIVPHTTHRIWIQFPKWNRTVQHEADEEGSIDEKKNNKLNRRWSVLQNFLAELSSLSVHARRRFDVQRVDRTRIVPQSRWCNKINISTRR